MVSVHHGVRLASSSSSSSSATQGSTSRSRRQQGWGSMVAAIKPSLLPGILTAMRNSSASRGARCNGRTRRVAMAVHVRASSSEIGFDYSGIDEDEPSANAPKQLQNKPRRPPKKRARQAIPSIICCRTEAEYRKMMAQVAPREHVMEVAQDALLNTEEIAELVGRRGRVTSIGIVSGRTESARSLARDALSTPVRPAVAAARDDEWRTAGQATVHKADTLWDAVQLASIYSPLNSAAQPVTCLFLDVPSITGNDLLLDTLAVTRSLVASLQRPGTRKLRVVVKSRSLSQQQETHFHAARVLENESGAEARRLEDALSWADRLAHQGSGGTSQQQQQQQQEPTVVLGADGVNEYRRAALLCARPGDSVMEIGCHIGTTTRIMAKAVGEDGAVLGVDVGASIVERARKHTGNADFPGRIKFEVGDAWDCRSVASLLGDDMIMGNGGVDLLLLDVGGVSGDSGLVEGVSLVRQLISLARPRVLVVKSSCLRQYAGQLVATRRLLDGDER